MNKKRYFVQYNDLTKIWNTPSEITKYWNNQIYANNEIKPLRLKCAIKLTIFEWQLKKRNKEKSNKEVKEWL